MKLLVISHELQGDSTVGSKLTNIVLSPMAEEGLNAGLEAVLLQIMTENPKIVTFTLPLTTGHWCYKEGHWK